jgi:hypothetical protein
MMKRYLVAAADSSVIERPPVLVCASSADDAIRKFNKEIASKEATFRESVLDLTVNVSWVERFYLSSEQESARFAATGTTGTEEEIVRSRILQFFTDRPDLGETFLRYMATEDKRVSVRRRPP